MNTKLITLSLLCCIAPGVMLATEPKAVDNAACTLQAELSRIESECAKVAPQSAPLLDNTKACAPAFVLKGARDLEMTIDGSAKTEYTRSWNTATLNSAGGIDRAAAYNANVELGGNVVYGKEKYGKPAFRVFLRSRLQYQAGRFDKVLVTNPSSVKIINAVLEVPGASLNATVPWYKHAGAELYLNSLFDQEAATDHFMKVGLFEYEVGRGIAYGSGYGTAKDYLGVYSGSQNFSPFGILLTGEMIKNSLGYEFYFARLEEKSADYKQTSAYTKKHIVANRNDGRAGSGNCNDVFAGTLKNEYSTDRFGDLKSSLFIMYNNAIDQQIERANDSQSKLITVGTGLEYAKGNFEIGVEVARNMGAEYVYNIDRNAVTLIRGFPGEEHDVVSAYNKVAVSSATDTFYNYSNAPVTNTFKSTVDSYSGSENGARIGSALSTTSLGDADDYVLQNAADRYRRAYKNTYTGWMAVADASYNWKPLNLKVSVAAGHASGDANPHTTAKDSETTREYEYNGFVGINENYAGKRVKSILALDARKLQAPLTNESGEMQYFDNSFTDMTFVGTGLAWRLPKRDLEMTANALAFWKDQRCYTYVYTLSTDGYGNDLARRYYGLELNSTFSWKLLPGLSLNGSAAIFVPGSFYYDVKGMPIGSNVIDTARVVISASQLDDSGRAPAVGRLGTDPQVALNLALQYKF